MARTDNLDHFLTDVADSIRYMLHTSDTKIPAREFDSKIMDISSDSDLTTKQYMQVSDLVSYPTTIEDSYYTASEVAKVDNLISSFDSLDYMTDYTRLEYIQVSSGSYIATNIIPTNHKIIADFKLNSTDDNITLFGTAAEEGGNYFHLTSYQGKWYWGLNGTEENGGTIDTNRHTVTFNSFERIVIDNVPLGSTAGTTSDSPIDIFRRELNGGYIYSDCNLYSMVIIDNETNQVELNLIPVKRNSDNEVGLYDTISNTFYTNSGTGTITGGGNY